MEDEKAYRIEKNLQEFYKNLIQHPNVTSIESDSNIYIKHSENNWPDLIINQSENFNSISKCIVSKSFKTKPIHFWLTNSEMVKENQKAIQEHQWIPTTIWDSMYHSKGQIIVNPVTNISIQTVQNEHEFDEWIKLVSEISFYPNKMDKSLFKYMFDQSSYIFVIGKQDNKVVSTAMIYNDGTTSGLYYINTKKESRRNGFGKAITQYSMQVAMKHFNSDIVLHASRMAKKLYLDLGFEVKGQLIIFAVS